MQVSSNDFRRQWAVIESDALDAVRRVGASGWYVLGDSVREFETTLAEELGLPAVVGVASGLDALEIALRCQGVARGDRVLTTPLSAFASTLALVRVGAVPVFVDVDAAGLLDLDLAEELLSRDGGLSGLLPVHLYGQALDLDRLDRFRRQFGLWVIEDCAQAVAATWRGRAVGSASEVAALSFYPTKNLGALGDGGAVLCAGPEQASMARALRHYGQTALYRHDFIGLNSRLDEMQAAVLSQALLPRLADFTFRRRRVAARYLAEIRHPGLELPAPSDPAGGVWHLFPVLVRGDRRMEFVRHLSEQGVETGCHYPLLIPDQVALQRQPHECVGDLPRARAFASSEVSLPIHPFLGAEEVSLVVGACNSWPEI